MDSPLVSLVLLALGIGLGALLAGAGYLMEVRHLARLLHERDPESNERIAAGTMPGMTELAAAINGEYNEAVPQLSALDREESSPELSRILSGVQLLPPDGMEKAYSECMAVLKRIYIASQRARLMSELRKPECSEEEKRRILAELTRLK